MLRTERRRGTPTPPYIREGVRELVDRCGVNLARKKLTLSREALLALAAGLPVLAGTVALARERLAAMPHILAIGRYRAKAPEAEK